MCRQVDVLAVGAHPDDIELGCGGTLLKLRSLGYRIGAADLTRGELGTRGTPEIREKEAARASRHLGLEFRANLLLEDGHVSVDRESRLRMIRLLRAARPGLVITHSQAGHPDHRQAALLVQQSVYLSGLACIETSHRRHRPATIAYWTVFDHPENPQVVVDVSEFFEQKEEALKAFTSQLHAPGSEEPETYLSRPDFLDQIRRFHGHLGNLAGCGFGEGFLLSRLPRVDDLTQC